MPIEDRPMKYVWLVKYACCSDVIAYSSKAKALIDVLDILQGYESYRIENNKTSWEALSLSDNECFVKINRLEIN